MPPARRGAIVIFFTTEHRGFRSIVHELSIAQSLVESIRAQATTHRSARVTRPGIRVGEMSGVQADALQFPFDRGLE
jgi:hypothetical protein